MLLELATCLVVLVARHLPSSDLLVLFPVRLHICLKMKLALIIVPFLAFLSIVTAARGPAYDPYKPEYGQIGCCRSAFPSKFVSLFAKMFESQFPF